MARSRPALAGILYLASIGTAIAATDPETAKLLAEVNDVASTPSRAGKSERSIYRNDYGGRYASDFSHNNHQSLYQPPFGARVKAVTDHPLNEHFRKVAKNNAVKYAPIYDKVNKLQYKPKYYVYPQYVDEDKPVYASKYPKYADKYTYKHKYPKYTDGYPKYEDVFHDSKPEHIEYKPSLPKEAPKYPSHIPQQPKHEVKYPVREEFYPKREQVYRKYKIQYHKPEEKYPVYKQHFLKPSYPENELKFREIYPVRDPAPFPAREPHPTPAPYEHVPPPQQYNVPEPVHHLPPPPPPPPAPRHTIPPPPAPKTVYHTYAVVPDSYHVTEEYHVRGTYPPPEPYHPPPPPPPPQDYPEYQLVPEPGRGHRAGKSLGRFTFDPEPFIETIAVAYHENEKNFGKPGFHRQSRFFSPEVPIHQAYPVPEYHEPKPAPADYPPPPPPVTEYHHETHVTEYTPPHVSQYHEQKHVQEFATPEHVPEYVPRPPPVTQYGYKNVQPARGHHRTPERTVTLTPYRVHVGSLYGLQPAASQTSSVVKKAPAGLSASTTEENTGGSGAENKQS